MFVFLHVTITARIDVNSVSIRADASTCSERAFG